ncbi:MAG: hypothetical protein M1451_01830, partial [Acidobacteria bacterium]|nr:hypothetical protein [Acidobacteriota bacterium]
MAKDVLPHGHHLPAVPAETRQDTRQHAQLRALESLAQTHDSISRSAPSQLCSADSVLTIAAEYGF